MSHKGLHSTGFASSRLQSYRKPEISEAQKCGIVLSKVIHLCAVTETFPAVSLAFCWVVNGPKKKTAAQGCKTRHFFLRFIHNTYKKVLLCKSCNFYLLILYVTLENEFFFCNNLTGEKNGKMFNLLAFNKNQ